MRILVSGGAGFIGSHVVDGYLDGGHEVLVVDNLFSGRRENVPSGVALAQADIRDRDAMDKIFADFRPEIVNHHAAQINVRYSVDDPAYDAQVNIIGLINLADLAARHGSDKFIFASSGGAVYGEQEYFPAREDHPTRPLSPYGVSKLAGEKYLYYFLATWGLRSVCLRYANVYGPRQDPHGEAGVVAIFMSRLLDGGQPVINGDGEQTRDYVFVGDVAAANMAVSRPAVTEGIFNVGTGIETSVNKLFSLANSAAGTTFKEYHGPAKKGEQRRSSIDASLLREVSGWEPAVDLAGGLAKTYKWFKEKASKS